MDFFPSACHFLQLCLIWSTFYNLIVDLIGSPGSSCLADILKICFGHFLRKKSSFSFIFYHFAHPLLSWRPPFIEEKGIYYIFAKFGPKQPKIFSFLLMKASLGGVVINFLFMVRLTIRG